MSQLTQERAIHPVQSGTEKLIHARVAVRDVLRAHNVSWRI